MMSTGLKGQAAGSAVSSGFVADPQRSACKHICGLALAHRMQVGVTKDEQAGFYVQKLKDLSTHLSLMHCPESLRIEMVLSDVKDDCLPTFLRMQWVRKCVTKPFTSPDY